MSRDFYIVAGLNLILFYPFFYYFYTALVRSRGHDGGKKRVGNQKETMKQLKKVILDRDQLREENKSLKLQLKREKNKKKVNTMPEGLRVFNESHEQNASALPQGRRWSIDIKLLALNIYIKEVPKLMRFYKIYFSLLSQQSQRCYCYQEK